MKAITLPATLNQYNFQLLAKKEKNKALKIRYLALSHLQSGKKATEAAQLVHKSSRMLHRWLKRFSIEGITGLKDKPGRGRKTHLPLDKNTEFKQLILSHLKTQQKSHITGVEVQKLLLNIYNIKCTIPTAYNTLARVGINS